MMPEDSYTMIITALLPLTAFMLVSQKNPYHALVIRGILGAVAALVYALFGAADVALTEALVGTMLSITLYAVAVRSSLILRLGILDAEAGWVLAPTAPLLAALQPLLKNYHLRLESRTYASHQALQTALQEKEIHAAVFASLEAEQASPSGPSSLQLRTRVQRLYSLMQAFLPDTLVEVTYMSPAEAVATSPPRFQQGASKPEVSL